MDANELKRLFEDVSQGRVGPDEALTRLRWQPFEKMGEFATVDLHRRLRCGFPEVVFGQGKTSDQIVRIMRRLSEQGEGGLVTRLGAETSERLRREFPQGEFNELGRTFRVRSERDEGPHMGRVVIITAGTADLPVAEEARATADAWNCEVALIADVGVAGIHRLFHRLPEVQGADAIVVVAGMEGALPSVVGGLVDCPVIAVPTSVGYGAHLNGLTALFGMLNSCASSVVVVNIDAGFNGGYVAGLIARRAGQARASAGAPSAKPTEFTDHATRACRDSTATSAADS